MATKLRIVKSTKAPSLPESTKASLLQKAGSLIEVLKLRHVKEPPTDHDFNFIANLSCKWHRNSFYFCATYNCPHPNAIAPSFETKFARLTYVSYDSFNLSYMQHTGQWFELFQNLPVDECLKIIEDDPTFTP